MVTIQRTEFDNKDALELRTGAVQLMAVTSFGPRIAFLGRAGANGGDNLLYWAPGAHRRGAWDMHGGHRLWTSRPLADESEESYSTDNDPCRVEILPDGFTLRAPAHPSNRIERGLSVRALDDDRLAIDHILCNTGDMLWSGGAWALTCTVPTANTSYVVPLGDGSRWDYATIVAFDKWGGSHGGEGFDDPQFSFGRDQFVLRPSGRENKRMIKGDAGILAMHDAERDLLFVKHAAFVRGGEYPLGTNLCLYTAPDRFMVEMETMGPAITLKPAETLHHTETWVLKPAPLQWPSNDALRRLGLYGTRESMLR